MSTAQPLPAVRSFFVGLNREPLAGGKVYTYAAGSTTPQATYKDPNQLDANNNPVILDALGSAEIRLTPTLSYKIRVFNNLDILQYEADYINGAEFPLLNIYAFFANTAAAGQGSGAVGFNPALNYSLNTVGAELKTLGTNLAALETAVDTELDLLQAEVAALIATVWRPGDLKISAVNTAPSGWLICDGSAVSRSTYADLFLAIGTAYGSGDGTTTFNIPDYRGRFMRGFDAGAGRDPGRGWAVPQADAMQVITGFIGTDDRIAGGGPNGVTAGAFRNNLTTRANALAAGVPLVDTTAQGGDGVFVCAEFNSSWSTGARTAAETRPQNLTVAVLIKT